MVHDLAVKAVTIAIQLLPHSLKALNEMINLMNRLDRTPFRPDR
jgi:hypothetical protein